MASDMSAGPVQGKAVAGHAKAGHEGSARENTHVSPDVLSWTPGFHLMLTRVPVIPVLVIHDPKKAVSLARALKAGGLDVLEVTLRTPQSLEGLRQIAAEVPDLHLGVGTVLTAAQAKEAVSAGAQFLVSPGSTRALTEECLALGKPFLPGVMTASEVMALQELGLRLFKFFPAEVAGGIPMLKALGGPLPTAQFCPTGGIDLEKARHYLKLKNVMCVGGSWVVPEQALESGDWGRITTLAREARTLRA